MSTNFIKSRVTPVGAVLVALIGACVAALWLTTAVTERQIEQAIRRDFTAASYLAVLQVEGERMRRYEKETFIHIIDAKERARYMAEFDRSYTQLLSLMDSMQAPSGDSFTDKDRTEMSTWKTAALHYGSAFTHLGLRALAIDAEKLSPEQRARQTLDFNELITDGKNQFRVLLLGAERMRLDKERSAKAIAGEVGSLMLSTRVSVLLAGLLLIGALLVLLRPQARKLPAAHGARADGTGSHGAWAASAHS